MRRMFVLLLAVVSLAGCRSVGMYDFGAGGSISKNESVDTAGAVFGFHGRNMFNGVVGIDYTFDITSDFAIDAKGGAGGEQVALVGARNGLGMGTSIGPAFRLFGAGDWFALLASPVFRMSFLGLGEAEEEMPQLNMFGAGIGLNLSSDFYLGSNFYMRVGFDLGVEWSKLEYLDNEFMIHDSVYEDAGIGARFVMYPRIGIGWRTGGVKKKESLEAAATKDSYQLPYGTDTLTDGVWLVGNYVDEFGDLTGERYITLPVKYFAKDSRQQPLALEAMTIVNAWNTDDQLMRRAKPKKRPEMMIRTNDNKIVRDSIIRMSYRVHGGDMDGLKVQDYWLQSKDVYTFDGSYIIPIRKLLGSDTHYSESQAEFLEPMMNALATGSDVEFSISTSGGYTSNYILPGKGFGRAASQLFDVSSP